MFLSDSVIAKFVYELKTMSQRPLDGMHLTDLMHARGINMRYLGNITLALEESSAKNHNYHICLSEIITRSVKTVFKSYIIDAPGQQLAPSIAHFMNCYLSNVVREKTNSGDQSPPHPTTNKKKKNKKGKGGLHFFASSSHYKACIKLEYILNLLYKTIKVFM